METSDLIALLDAAQKKHAALIHAKPEEKQAAFGAASYELQNLSRELNGMKMHTSGPRKTALHQCVKDLAELSRDVSRISESDGPHLTSMIFIGGEYAKIRSRLQSEV